METLTVETAQSKTPAQLYIARVEALQINQGLLDMFQTGGQYQIDAANPAVSFNDICECQYHESEYLGGMAEAICAQLKAELDGCEGKA